jgi:hypothetical protein
VIKNSRGRTVRNPIHEDYIQFLKPYKITKKIDDRQSKSKNNPTQIINKKLKANQKKMKQTIKSVKPKHKILTISSKSLKKKLKVQKVKPNIVSPQKKQ